VSIAGRAGSATGVAAGTDSICALAEAVKIRQIENKTIKAFMNQQSNSFGRFCKQVLFNKDPSI
jgi:hypothetical protein